MNTTVLPTYSKNSQTACTVCASSTYTQPYLATHRAAITVASTPEQPQAISEK